MGEPMVLRLLDARPQFPQRAEFRHGEELIRIGTESEEEHAPCRIERNAFRLCLGRSPTLREMERLKSFFSNQKEEFTASPIDAKELTGEISSETGAALAERAAWIMMARVLLNLDEFITRE